MRAKQTLDLLESVRSRLSYPVTRTYVSGVVESSRASGGVHYEGNDSAARGETFLRALEGHLKEAHAYFLTDEMLSVVLWAAQGLDAKDTFDQSLWPTEHGFLVIENGMVHHDIRGRLVVTKALSWGPVHLGRGGGAPPKGHGMQVVYWSDTEDARDEVNQALAPKMSSFMHSIGRLHVAHVEVVPFGTAVGEAVITVSEEAERRALREFDLPVVPQAENHLRWVLAFLMLINQTLAAPEREEVSKKQAARYAKKKIPSMVTVVKMRRVAGGSRTEGESRVEWHRRWIVRGFWRNARVGENYPGAKQDKDGHYRAKIWIAPYAKNAHRTDLPWIVPTKIYSLSR